MSLPYSVKHLLPAFFATATAVSNSFADESGAVRTECLDNGEVFFTSEIGDIGEFDSASYGVSLLQVIALPDHSADLYVFGPADVICVVLNE